MAAAGAMVPAVVCGVSGAVAVCAVATGAIASANAVTAQAPGKQVLAWIGIDGSLAIHACQRRVCALDEGGKRNHSERDGQRNVNGSPSQFGGQSGVAFITADEWCG